jgi:hypothetical protein
MSHSSMRRRDFLKTSLAGVATAGALSGAAFAGPHGKKIVTFCADVTPPYGTPLYSSYKPLEVIEQSLLAKGVIIDSGGKRYVLCAVDWCELCNSTHTLFRQKIAEAVGTDIANVAVQTVHQHTSIMGDADAVRLLETTANPGPRTPAPFMEKCAVRVAEAARASLPGLMPFDRIGVGQGKVERVASNRRVPVGEGKVGFRASSCRDETFIALPEGVIDPFIKTITFALGKQPLVRLHYYATHPQSFYGDPRASIDFPGMARERLQEKEKVFQIYFTGCSGDIAAGKYNNGTPPVRDELAQRMYDGMEAAIRATRYRRAPTIHWTTVDLTLKPRDDGSFSEAACRAGMADEKKGVNGRLGDASTLAFRQHAGKPIQLSALRMGHVRILHLPGEAMIAFQLYAQQQRPHDFVAVAAYGDCGCGYICLEKSFPEGGYEPTASNVVPETEAALKGAIGRLLG